MANVFNTTNASFFYIYLDVFNSFIIILVLNTSQHWQFRAIVHKSVHYENYIAPLQITHGNFLNILTRMLNTINDAIFINVVETNLCVTLGIINKLFETPLFIMGLILV